MGRLYALYNYVCGILYGTAYVVIDLLCKVTRLACERGLDLFRHSLNTRKDRYLLIPAILTVETCTLLMGKRPKEGCYSWVKGESTA